MFKLAFLSLSLVLLLGFFNPAVSFAGEEQDFLEIEFEEIVVFHPNDWLGHGELNDVFYLFPLDAEYEDFMVNINFIIEHGRENDDLDFWEELIIDLEETIKNFNLREKEEVKIDGLPGYKLIYTGYLPEIFPDKIKWAQVVTFIEDEKFLVITYTASKKTFPEFKDDALKIIFQTKVN